MLKELLNNPLVACKYKYYDLVPFHKFHNAYIDYKYQIMALMPDYSAKDMLLFYGNMEKWKLRSRMQVTLNIHDDQRQIS